MPRAPWLHDFSLRFGLYNKAAMPMVDGMEDPVDNFRARAVAILRDQAEQARLKAPFEAGNFDRAADLIQGLARNPPQTPPAAP